MDFKFEGLNLNNTYYSLTELADFCLYELISKDLPQWKREVYGFMVEFISPTETITQFTSGTTGSAKHFKISKKMMVESAAMTASFFNLDKHQKALLCLPINYIAGKMMVVRAFVSGMDLMLANPSGTPDISSFGQIDFCAMVPLQVSNLLSKPEIFNNIKTLIVGGSEVNPELQEKLQSIDTHVYETFGMTETCSHIALKRLNGPDASNYFNTLAQVKITLDDRACLVINAPFLDEEIITNDMVEISGENQFRWLGRYDHVINSGGIKINPESLEKDIEKIIHKKVVIGSKADKLLGRKVVLVIESENIALEENSLFEKLKLELPKHLLPKEIVAIPKFPRNKNLKVDRKKIQAYLNKQPNN